MVGFVLTLFAYAPPPPPTSYYSIKGGDFTTTGNWSTSSHEGSSCSCAPDCSIGNNEDVYIEHVMTTTCDPFEVEGTGSLTIRSGGSLVLPDNASLIGNGDITIDFGATLYVAGDFDVSGNGDVTVNGDLIVVGDLNTAGSAAICGTGSISYGGSITGSGVCGTISTTQSNTLPVELLYFGATHESDGVLLQWATATEDGNEYFTIERSQNGSSFEAIQEVAGAGNSTTTLYYEFVDETPFIGTSYYRLKQTDFDDKYTYSDLTSVEVESSGAGECVLAVNPNPCLGNCTVNLSECPANAASKITISMYDAAGNLVNSWLPSRNDDGGFSFHLDKTNNLKPGVYMIAGVSSSERYGERIIVK